MWNAGRGRLETGGLTAEPEQGRRVLPREEPARQLDAGTVQAAHETTFSVVVLARNEAANLPRCLAALAAISSDVTVVDDYSTDETWVAAERSGARVCKHRFESFAHQRNWAMDNGGLQDGWVLYLDADEVVTPELADEIRIATASASTDVAGFLLSYKTMLNGRWLKHSSTYPVWILRLVRRGRVRYIERGHGEGYEADGQVLRLQQPFLHYNFSKGLTDWLDRHNRYSSQEARACLDAREAGGVDWRGLVSLDGHRRRRALKELSFRLPFRPWLKFAYMYILRMGFLDGMPGLTYCSLQAIYEYMICLKVRELKDARRDCRSTRNKESGRC